MKKYEYKALFYAIEGKGTHYWCYWADCQKKAYGRKEKARLSAGIPMQMEQLQEALQELDEEGWELVTMSTTITFMTRQGTAMLRRMLGAN
jgi:hypothetical protein